MGTLKNNDSGFGAVEALVILVILVLIGAAGYMVYKNHHKTIATKTGATPNKPATPASPQVPIYKIATTVPSGWRTYTNTRQGFSIAYPGTWITSTSSDKSNTIFAQENVSYFNAEFTEPNASSGNLPNPYYYDVTVTNQTLKQALNSDEQVLVYQNSAAGSAVTPKVASVTQYSFKGQPATLLDTIITDNSSGTKTYNSDLLIAANNVVYDFFAQDNSLNGPLTNALISTALQSLKF